jgi:hypothetical protein
MASKTPRALLIFPDLYKPSRSAALPSPYFQPVQFSRNLRTALSNCLQAQPLREDQPLSRIGNGERDPPPASDQHRCRKILIRLNLWPLTRPLYREHVTTSPLSLEEGHSRESFVGPAGPGPEDGPSAISGEVLPVSGRPCEPHAGVDVMA